MKVWNRLRLKAAQLKAEAQVLVIAYRDERTPASARMLIALTVAYLLSPIDLIPDFIPVLGILDDLIIVPILISLSLRLLPPVVLHEAREQVKNHPEKLKKNRWLMAVAIVLIWLAAFYFLYTRLAHLWRR